MLAANFLSAKELNVDQKTLDAAIRVLRMLECGEFTHVKPGEGLKNLPEYGFNMGVWFQRSDNACGTVGCIGGWMSLFIGGDLRDRRGEYLGYENEAWDDLFHPPFWDFKHYTMEQAAKALRSMLTTGKPDWSE